MDDAHVEDLLQRCRKHDESAWRELVERYAGLVYAIARRSGLSPEQCDDAAQIVFSILWRRLHTVREGIGLAGWLATVARRESWRVRRRQAQPGEALDLDGLVLDPEDFAERVDRVQRVREGLAKLEPRCRELLTALFLESPQPDYETVAVRLGLASGSIGPIRRRCLTRLLEVLSKEDGL